MNPEENENLNNFIKESVSFLVKKKGTKIRDALNVVMEDYIDDMDEEKLLLGLDALAELMDKEFEL